MATDSEYQEGMSSDPNKTGADAADQVMNKEQAQNYMKIVAWATSNFKRIKEARSELERQWYQNLYFYAGKQYVQPAKNASIKTPNGFITPPAPYYVQRPVINRIRPTIRTEVAKLTANKPNAYVIPATSDDRDLFAAQAGEQLWDSTFREYELGTILRRAIFWTATCGTGFIKAYWDPAKQDRNAQQQPSPLGLPPKPSGDFCYDPISPFHIFCPDFGEEDLERQPYVIHAQERPLDELIMLYPGFKLAGKPSTSEKLFDASGYQADTMDNADKLQGSKALVLEVWVKPNRVSLFPNGALFTLIGDQIVYGQMSFPYSHGRYPFVKIDHIPTGRFYAESTITDLIPLQKEYNRTRGQIIEAKNRMAKPQLLAEIGSIDPKKITTEPGQVIMYQPGHAKPEPLPLQSLPSYVLQELDRITTDWADISGIHEVSQGSAPPGVTAATAISFLQEQDETKLSHTVQSIERAVERIAQMTLSYVVDYWDQERIIRVVGDSGAFDSKALKGSDLVGNTDIKVEAGSALPVSRAAKQAFIMDLMNNGHISKEDGLAVLEMGGINKIYDKLQVDVKQAQRENIRMAKVNQQEVLGFHMDQELKQMQDESVMKNENGEPVDENGMPIPPPLFVDVNSWDDHARHIIVHNNYRKSQEFETLDDTAKALFDEHVNRHLAMLGLMDQGAQQAAQMGMQPPAGPEQGGPPPPPPGMEQGPPPPESGPPQ